MEGHGHMNLIQSLFMLWLSASMVNGLSKEKKNKRFVWFVQNVHFVLISKLIIWILNNKNTIGLNNQLNQKPNS